MYCRLSIPSHAKPVLEARDALYWVGKYKNIILVLSAKHSKSSILLKVWRKKETQHWAAIQCHISSQVLITHNHNHCEAKLANILKVACMKDT